MHLKVSRHLKEGQDMSTVECDATFTRRTILCTTLSSGCLRQFVPFLCECMDEVFLFCRRIVSTSNLPHPQNIPHAFSMGFRSGERAGHTRDVEHPSTTLSAIPERRVFDDSVLRCRP
ncbi:hypothetical protein TNCV_1226701 [Trichonephila clavipes]|nr:hypothetical protein TNCV_1226701 [Trichonephila clavipes]